MHSNELAAVVFSHQKSVPVVDYLKNDPRRRRLDVRARLIIVPRRNKYFDRLPGIITRTSRKKTWKSEITPPSPFVVVIHFTARQVPYAHQEYIKKKKNPCIYYFNIYIYYIPIGKEERARVETKKGIRVLLLFK